jgi:hypothetical protein
MHHINPIPPELDEPDPNRKLFYSKAQNPHFVMPLAKAQISNKF